MWLTSITGIQGRVSVSASRGRFDRLGCLVRPQRRPVWAHLGHRLKGINDGQQTCLHPNLCPDRAAVVAGAVEPFVVTSRCGRERLEHWASREDPLAIVN